METALVFLLTPTYILSLHHVIESDYIHIIHIG